MYDVTRIKQCICCWYDLLGYGSPFIDSKWNLKDPRCKRNIRRMKNIKEWFLGVLSINCHATKLFINDGAICNIDVDIKNDTDLYELLFFIETLIKDFYIINKIDKRSGFPGIRGVLTCGNRFDYENTDTDYDVLRKRTISYHPREFQMNTAFSKAFIIEESGSKAGIKGSNLYIDKELLILFQNIFKNSDKHSIQVKVKDDILEIIVTFGAAWFATITLDIKEVTYQNRGIDTKLYRLMQIESKLDKMAENAAKQQALRYALMEEDDE